MSSGDADSSLPLRGIKVVDFSKMIGGPKTGMILADMGADVIKVEGPGQEDPSRLSGQVPGLTFTACNRNKRSVMLDLTKESGRAAARRLALSADVLIEANRPGAMARWGLAYEQLCEEAPRLIYTSLSGYGAQGPDAQRGSIDTIIQAESGLMMNSGMEGAPPVMLGGYIVDETAGCLMIQSILLALYNRERTGRGAYSEINLLDTAIYLQSDEIAYASLTGRQPPRSGNMLRGTAPAGVVNTSDGAMVVAALNDPMFQRLCATLGVPELAEDDRFATRALRKQNHALLLETLNVPLSSRTRAEWHALFEANKILSGPVRTYVEVLAQPQVEANEILLDGSHKGEPLKLVRWPVRFAGQRFPRDVKEAPPAGRDTEMVLREIGYSGEDLAILTG